MMQLSPLWLYDGPDRDIESVLSLTPNMVTADVRAWMDDDRREPVRHIQRDADGTVTVKVKGMILPRRSFLLDFFGVEHVGCAELIEELDGIEAQDVRLVVDSLGGNAAGVGDVHSAVTRLADRSNVWAEISDCCSAAYWIASGAGALLSMDVTGMIGSIGAYARVYEPKIEGLRTIRAPQSPDKAPEGEDLDASVSDVLFEVCALMHEDITGCRSDIDAAALTGKAWVARTLERKGAMGLVDRFAWGESAEPAKPTKAAEARSARLAADLAPQLTARAREWLAGARLSAEAARVIEGLFDRMPSLEGEEIGVCEAQEVDEEAARSALEAQAVEAAARFLGRKPEDMRRPQGGLTLGVN